MLSDLSAQLRKRHEISEVTNMPINITQNVLMNTMSQAN